MRWRSILGRVITGDDGPGLVGQHDGVDPVASLEFHKDPADVSFDGGFAEAKALGDLAVGEALADETENVELTGLRTWSRSSGVPGRGRRTYSVIAGGLSPGRGGRRRSLRSVWRRRGRRVWSSALSV